SSTVFLDENSVLIRRDAALRYQAKLEQEAREKSEEERKRVDPDKDGRDGTNKDESGDGKDTNTGPGTGQVLITESQKKRFYGSVIFEA
ncbi:hypothetical protein OFN24_29190, partial [Escherichia coli]|nr:hypothetical protein [Escherichia coli]